jgi:auxin responsive GH3 family protein
MCYYEFIKVKDVEEFRDGKVVDLVDVEVGGYYDLVVTTFTGEPPRAHASLSIS